MRRALKLESALFAVALAAGAVISGCAGAPRRIDASSSEKSALEERGIAEIPQALVHMQLAKEQMKLAEGMVSNDEWEQADSMLGRAQADADLALLLFQEESVKSKTMAAVKRARQHREQNEAPAEENNQSNERISP